VMMTHRSLGIESHLLGGRRHFNGRWCLFNLADLADKTGIKMQYSKHFVINKRELTANRTHMCCKFNLNQNSDILIRKCRRLATPI